MAKLNQALKVCERSKKRFFVAVLRKYLNVDNFSKDSLAIRNISQDRWSNMGLRYFYEAFLF
jgi:hypothetical protein